MAATSASVFRNLDCLSLFAYSKYNSAGISNFVFIFFQNLRFQIGSAAYLQMWLIHGRLRYLKQISLEGTIVLAIVKLTH